MVIKLLIATHVNYLSNKTHNMAVSLEHSILHTVARVLFLFLGRDLTGKE